ncbi:hypothetical protein Peur_019771 [Populus x canadensis]
MPSILLFSLAKILKRHRSYFEEKTALSNGANDAELYHGKYEKKIKLFAELLQTVQRQVGNSNFEELTLSDLEQTEMQLDAALRRTRARKIPNNSMFGYTCGLQSEIHIGRVAVMEMTLREENQRLQTQVVAMNNDNETNGMMSGSFEPLFGLLKQ